MKHLCKVVVFSAVFSVLPLSASMIIQPPFLIGISVGGITQSTSNFIATFDPSSNQGSIGGSLSGALWTLDLNIKADPDPFVLYSVGGTNLTGAPLAFSFTFLTPVVLGPYDHLTNSFNGSLTDLFGDGASVTGTVQMALLDGSNVPAVQLGAFTCAYGTNPPLTNHPCPAGPGFGPVDALVPSAFYTTLAVNLSFTVSPMDSASFNGGAILDVQPTTRSFTPEPASLTMGLIGLALIPLANRMRRRS